MRIRSAALLLMAIALLACATSAPAASARGPLSGVRMLSPRPPVSLPSEPTNAGAQAPAGLPRTGIDMPVLLAAGSILIALGLAGRSVSGRLRR